MKSLLFFSFCIIVSAAQESQSRDLGTIGSALQRVGKILFMGDTLTFGQNANYVLGEEHVNLTSCNEDLGDLQKDIFLKIVSAGIDCARKYYRGLSLGSSSAELNETFNAFYAKYSQLQRNCANATGSVDVAFFAVDQCVIDQGPDFRPEIEKLLIGLPKLGSAFVYVLDGLFEVPMCFMEKTSSSAKEILNKIVKSKCLKNTVFRTDYNFGTLADFLEGGVDLTQGLASISKNTEFVRRQIIQKPLKLFFDIVKNFMNHAW